MEHLSLGTAGLAGLMGYLVVFFGLILLMIVVLILGAIMKNSAKKAAPAAAPAQKKEDGALAPGSAGRLTLFDVPDRDAAMLMAIIADRLGKPLNELRFISIKEIQES